MAAHRVGGRMGDIITAHEGRKKRYDSEGTEAAAFSHHVLLLAAAAFFAFPPRRPTKWRTRRHKNARGEKALL